MLCKEVITYNLWEVITLSIDITEKVLKYLDKRKIHSLVIDLIPNETNPG
ncbi:hypothetical protein SDC9_150161 [bioreactor metagenome]|uniref:Uncharacterized protein n=1 Tax=bioreactor metagenome TaxID=1076179 RepID=A0A645ENK4_9ZZZZ